MCGRYRLSRRKEILAEYFEADDTDCDWAPRFNVAPTQPVPTIRQNPREPRRQLSVMRWGLIPYWAKDAGIGSRTINARSETASTLPAFREPLRQRRCLIPADGFYEWKKLKGSKQPYCFTMADDSLFAFAGLWDQWKDHDGKMIHTCTILTTKPNSLLADVHDRMPVILPRDSYDDWLDPGLTDATVVTELLRPFDSKLMKVYPVSTRVNSTKNDDAACAEPLRVEELRQVRGLFDQ
jgi:putative SOS response-associated peptidase YedK